MQSFTKVYLVGSGPSGAELLSLRAAELLGIADVIIYDALVDASIHRLFAPEAKLIYVGKRAGAHSLTQSEINECLIAEAKALASGRVVRLKGGDPFVFGRGGEEMIALRGAGIPYEVVPGITAGIAAPAYCGVPVTHRGISRSVTLITAFSKDGGLPPLDWGAYSRLDGTLVFYMSMRVVPEIVAALCSAGMPANRPAAIISHGTRPQQGITILELADFSPERFDYASFTPGLFVVGEVLGFAEDYGWYQPSPLAGQRILITRSEGNTSELSQLFIAEGAEPRVLPTFELKATTPDTALLPTAPEEAILAFTSPNSVEFFLDYLSAQGLDARYLARFEALAAIGPATAKALHKRNFVPDLIAPVHTAVGFAEALAKAYPTAKCVYHPTSDKTSGELEERLSALGIVTDTRTLYHNVPVPYAYDELSQLLSEGLDWVSFCSSSAVHNFVHLLRQHRLENKLNALRLVAIGPSTRQTLYDYGYSDVLMPEEATLPALVSAMRQSLEG